MHRENRKMIKVKNQSATLNTDLQTISTGLLGVALGDAQYLAQTVEHSSQRRVTMTVFVGTVVSVLITALFYALLNGVLGYDNTTALQAVGTVIWHIVAQALVMLLVVYAVSHFSYHHLQSLQTDKTISLSFIEHTQMLATLIMLHTILGQLATVFANLFLVEQFGLASGSFVIIPVIALMVAVGIYFWAWVWRSLRLFYGLRARSLMTVFAATFVSYTLITMIYGWVAPLLTSPITDHLMW